MFNIDYSILPAVTVSYTNEKRFYNTPKGSFPSVTSILSATNESEGLLKWRNKVGEEEAKRIMKEAASRGTLVHKYVEDYFNKNLDLEVFNKEATDVKHLSNSIIEYVLKNNITILGQEIALWHDELKYAGRCDATGIYNDEFILLDWKTSSKLKRVDWITDYFLQCTAYCLAHNRLLNTKIKKFRIVIGIEDKPVQVFEGAPFHYISQLKYRLNKYEQQKI